MTPAALDQLRISPTYWVDEILTVVNGFVNVAIAIAYFSIGFPLIGNNGRPWGNVAQD